MRRRALLTALFPATVAAQDQERRVRWFPRPRPANKITVTWIENYQPPPVPGLAPIPLQVMVQDEYAETTAYCITVDYLDTSGNFQSCTVTIDRQNLTGWSRAAMPIQHLWTVKRVAVTALTPTGYVERTSPVYWQP